MKPSELTPLTALVSALPYSARQVSLAGGCRVASINTPNQLLCQKLCELIVEAGWVVPSQSFKGRCTNIDAGFLF